MKKAMLLSGLVVGVVLSVVGCGGSSDGQSIVGIWHKDCHKNSHGHYRTNHYVFKDDKTGRYEKKAYVDDKCENLDYAEEYDFTYKTGGAATDNNGKITTKLDLVKDFHGMKHPDFTMYRFKENGNLLIASYTDAHPGDDDASRENHIDPNWTGYTRVK